MLSVHMSQSCITFNIVHNSVLQDHLAGAVHSLSNMLFTVSQVAQRQGTVSQEVARQTDGVLLAVGALSSVLKKKVSPLCMPAQRMQTPASSVLHCSLRAQAYI